MPKTNAKSNGRIGTKKAVIVTVLYTMKSIGWKEGLAMRVEDPVIHPRDPIQL